MARIPMTSGFVIIPEGEYVFRIYDATYDEDFGRIEIKLVNAQGATHTERFSIKDICWSYRKCNETLRTWSMSSYQLQTSPCMNEESSGVLQANRFKTES